MWNVELDGWHVCLLSVISLSTDSCRRVTSMTRVIRGFPQSKPFSGTLPWNLQWRLPSTPFPIHNDKSTINSLHNWKSWLQTGRQKRWKFESRWGQEISLLHVLQIDSGTHPASYPVGTGSSFPWVKRPGREIDHSPPTSVEVKKMWIYTITPPYAFMA
jgi:hypothetical protein